MEIVLLRPALQAGRGAGDDVGGKTILPILNSRARWLAPDAYHRERLDRITLCRDNDRIGVRHRSMRMLNDEAGWQFH